MIGSRVASLLRLASCVPHLAHSHHLSSPNGLLAHSPVEEIADERAELLSQGEVGTKLQGSRVRGLSGEGDTDAGGECHEDEECHSRTRHSAEDTKHRHADDDGDDEQVAPDAQLEQRVSTSRNPGQPPVVR